MQIDPKTGASLPPLQPAGTTVVSAHAGHSVAESHLAATGFAPTALLAGLLDELKRLPEIRQEVVRQLRAKLLRGEMISANSSAEVALALLDVEMIRR